MRFGEAEPNRIELKPIELAVLRHIALYRLTLIPVIERLFTTQHGGNAGTLLVKLAKLGLLRHHKKVADGAFPGRVPFFSLMPLGARMAGASEDRAEPLGPAALRTHLATLWFCIMSDERRYRLEPRELGSIFADHAPHANIPCCLADEKEGPKIYRVYETSTNIPKTIKQLRATLTAIWDAPTLRPWLMSGDLGFAVLGETTAKCGHLNKAIKEAKNEKPCVADECHVIVRFAPSPSTLKSALDALRRKKPNDR